MKKFILIAIGFFFTIVIMASCSGSGSAEKASEDSGRIADSIDEVEAAQATAEQARQDSIRQDSIALEEKFNLAQKSFIDNRSWLKTLPKFGFELKSKKTTEDWDEWEGTDRVLDTKYIYERDLNGRIVTFEFTLSKYKDGGMEIGNGYDATMKIKDPQELESFISNIKKLGKTKNGYLYDGSDRGIWVRQEGNSISFSGEH